MKIRKAAKIQMKPAPKYKKIEVAGKEEAKKDLKKADKAAPKKDEKKPKKKVTKK
jgi:hypothetical protein